MLYRKRVQYLLRTRAKAATQHGTAHTHAHAHAHAHAHGHTHSQLVMGGCSSKKRVGVVQVIHQPTHQAVQQQSATAQKAERAWHEHTTDTTHTTAPPMAKAKAKKTQTRKSRSRVCPHPSANANTGMDAFERTHSDTSVDSGFDDQDAATTVTEVEDTVVFGSTSEGHDVEATKPSGSARRASKRPRVSTTIMVSTHTHTPTIYSTYATPEKQNTSTYTSWSHTPSTDMADGHAAANTSEDEGVFNGQDSHANGRSNGIEELDVNDYLNDPELLNCDRGRSTPHPRSETQSARSALSVTDRRPQTPGGCAFTVTFDDADTKSPRCKSPSRLRALESQPEWKQKNPDVVRAKLEKKLKSAERRRRQHQHKVQTKMNVEMTKLEDAKAMLTRESTSLNRNIDTRASKATENRERHLKQLQTKLKAKEAQAQRVRVNRALRAKEFEESQAQAALSMLNTAGAGGGRDPFASADLATSQTLVCA